jgi:hypothetical protein
VATRWNSSLDMLERYLQLRPAISAVKADPISKNHKDTEKEEEITIIEEVVKVGKFINRLDKCLV